MLFFPNQGISSLVFPPLQLGEVEFVPGLHIVDLHQDGVFSPLFDFELKENGFFILFGTGVGGGAEHLH